MLYSGKGRNTMKIVMLGAPGAGKGTQAQMIAEKFGLPHISTGDIFRANIKNGTELGKKAKAFMDAGKLVPDEIIIDIIKERTAKPDCAHGYILDGVPRTIPQAEAMEEMGLEVDIALSIEIEDHVIIERMAGRRTCKECSQTFHVVSNPPKQDGVCDFCGGELHIRKDDAPEIVMDRLETYHRETEPLKEFYAQRGKLVSVENQPSIDAMTAEIKKALEI
jgi:adenylate kinase